VVAVVVSLGMGADGDPRHSRSPDREGASGGFARSFQKYQYTQFTKDLCASICGSIFCIQQ
jgi:hypothetical protein